MIDRVAFLARWRGTPYDRRHRHCFWLVALARREIFGHDDLPIAHPDLVHCRRLRAAAIAAHPVRADWIAIAAPVDGAIALMSCNGRDDVHAGLYLADRGGRILHTDQPHGIVVDDPVELTAVRGFSIGYFAHRDDVADAPTR